MPRLLGPRAVWGVVRAGDLRARLRALREGQGGLRLALAAAVITTGLVDALADGPLDTAELSRRLGATDDDLALTWLRAASAAGFVEERRGRWRLTRNGRAVQADDLVRAQYEAFSGFHTGLYRDLGATLRGRRRRDVVDEAELISRVSAAFEPFVLGELTRVVAATAPRRVLDVGCGAGVDLATMVSAAPATTGVGIDLDAASVALAEKTLVAFGVADRARIVRGDVRDAVRDAVRDRGGPFAEPFDLALLANVLYYLPPPERVPLLRAVRDALAPGGLLLVVTTVAEDGLFSRHFDLLLRAQEGAMQLSDAGTLVDQLVEAGLTDVELRRLVPGRPLVLVRGTAPAGVAPPR